MSGGSEEEAKACKAVILIGGASKGTRFRPLSLGVPKPLFPLANQAMIHHHIAACVTQLPRLTEIVLLGFFEPNLFARFLEQAQQEFQIPIRFLREDVRLGTAGGLYKFREALCEGLEADATLFIFNCDIMASSFPLLQLERFHREHGRLATIMSKRVQSQEARNYGCLVADPSSHHVLHYAEKPETFVSDLVNCGVYLFRREIFDRIAAIAQQKPSMERDLITRLYSDSQNDGEDVKIRLEQDLLRQLAGKQELYAYEYEGLWSPVKRPIDSLSVNQMLLEELRPSVAEEYRAMVTGHVLIDQGTTIHESARIGSNVTIGKNVTVGAGVRIVNSIILDGVVIKARACVINSIIGWHSTIGQWCRIEGSEGQITILGEGVTTKPEIIVRNCVVLPHKELSRNQADQIIL